MNAGNGHSSAIISLGLGLGAIIPENLEGIIRVVLAIGSLITAIMAIRYYHYATKEKKEALRKHRGHTHR